MDGVPIKTVDEVGGLGRWVVGGMVHYVLTCSCVAGSGSVARPALVCAALLLPLAAPAGERDPSSTCPTCFFRCQVMHDLLESGITEDQLYEAGEPCFPGGTTYSHNHSATEDQPVQSPLASARAAQV